MNHDELTEQSKNHDHGYENGRHWSMDPKYLTIMLALVANIVAVAWGASNFSTRLEVVEGIQEDGGLRFARIEVAQQTLTVQQAHFDGQIRALKDTVSRVERLVDKVGHTHPAPIVPR